MATLYKVNKPTDNYTVQVSFSDEVAGHMRGIDLALGSIAITGKAPGHIDALTLSFTSVASVTVGTGFAISDDNTFNIDVTSSILVDITSSGAGGLDTGSEAASTWYAVWLIGDSTSVNSPSAILSVSFTAPTLPAGYDSKRYVGSVRNDLSSDFHDFVQTGSSRRRVIDYHEDRQTTLQVLTLGTATTFATVDLSSLVPETSERCFLFVQKNNAGSSVVILRYTGFTLASGKWVVEQFGRDQLEVYIPGQDIEYLNLSLLGTPGNASLSVMGYVEDL